jgi:hypothetical protein
MTHEASKEVFPKFFLWLANVSQFIYMYFISFVELYILKVWTDTYTEHFS